MKIKSQVCRSLNNKRVGDKYPNYIYLLFPRRSCQKKRLRNVLSIYIGYKRQVVYYERIAIPNLFKRDKPRSSHGVLYIIISPIVLKFLAKEIDNDLFLIYKED